MNERTQLRKYEILRFWSKRKKRKGKSILEQKPQDLKAIGNSSLPNNLFHYYFPFKFSFHLENS